MTKQLSLDFHLSQSYRAYIPFSQDVSYLDDIISSTLQAKRAVFFIRGLANSGKSACLTYLCSKVANEGCIAGLIDLSKLSKSSYFQAIIDEIYNVDLLCIDNVDDLLLDMDQADCLLQLFNTLPLATIVFTASVASDKVSNSSLRHFLMAFLQQQHTIQPSSAVELEK